MKHDNNVDFQPDFQMEKNIYILHVRSKILESRRLKGVVNSVFSVRDLSFPFSYFLVRHITSALISL